MTWFCPCLIVTVTLGLIGLNGFQDRAENDRSDTTEKENFSELPAMAPFDRLSAVIDQARRAEARGNKRLALILYREAESLTPTLGDTGARAFLIIKYRELAIEAAGLDWRRVEHKFEDLRKIADQHPFWTDSQLERALYEAEIRLADQPEDYEKEAALRLLNKEIILIVQSLGDDISPQLLDRSRSFGYALEDTYGKRKLMPKRREPVSR